MYSHKDRIRAVWLYIKLGKRVGLTIRRVEAERIGLPPINEIALTEAE